MKSTVRLSLADAVRVLVIRQVTFAALLLATLLYNDLPCHAQRLPENCLHYYNPPSGIVQHNIGNIHALVTNQGVVFGALRDTFPVIDPFTGERIAGSAYPANTSTTYMYTGFMVGAIINGDTLVSNFGHSEMQPDTFPYNGYCLQSNGAFPEFFTHSARADVDITCEFTDTFVYVPAPNQISGLQYDPRPHIPMYLKFTQRSMSWSAPGVDDFILYEMTIENIGHKNLRDAFVGLVYDLLYRGWPGSDFDTLGGNCGFLRFTPAPEGCGFAMEANTAFSMSLTGVSSGGQWTDSSMRAAMGIKLLERPEDAQTVNFNWWSIKEDTGGIFNNLPPSWGPRHPKAPNERRFQSMGPYPYGEPWHDNNMYYLMAHPEIDYDKMFAAVNYSAFDWLPPDQDNAIYHATTSGGRAVLSFGPIDLDPGDRTSFVFAIVGGDSVHVNPDDFARLWDPYNPKPFYNSLDFSLLGRNARAAEWVYDNPAVDTDGDGYRGEFFVCNGDTTWYKGDGSPDWRADQPLPAPYVRLYAEDGKLTVRWNGYQTENFVDQFTQQKDFEGYRVYLGQDKRTEGLTVMKSYDKLDFTRYEFVKYSSGAVRWLAPQQPFSLDSLKALYGQDFEPLLYTRVNPFHLDSNYYYFLAQDFNQFDLTIPTGIRKAYPEITEPPPSDTNLWTDSIVTIEHDSLRLPKYYEYEYIADNLLPSVPYFVAVTAFDFGFAKGGIPARESEKSATLTRAFAQTSTDTVLSQNLEAYVYPNPYRVDADYVENGYENRDASQPDQRSRRVHFANLPNVCTIHIYSLDGDRIKTIEHNYQPDSPEAMHEEWDLITRNRQLITSGLYYWVVESPLRATQIGKLVVIK